MKTRNAVLLIGLALGLSGCGLESYSTRAMEAGTDTYTVATDDPSAAVARQAAIGQAQVHCGSLSKEILVTDQSARAVDGRNVHEVTFRYLVKGDPALAR